MIVKIRLHLCVFWMIIIAGSIIIGISVNNILFEGWRLALLIIGVTLIFAGGCFDLKSMIK